jgi:hypothetical protein
MHEKNSGQDVEDYLLASIADSEGIHKVADLS